LIDRKILMQLLGIRDSEQLSRSRRDWIEAALQSEGKIREGRWSENVAVGSLSFVEQVKAGLGAWGLGREIASNEVSHEVREAQGSYSGQFVGEKAVLSQKNVLLWRVF
jgi:hypothetical protein